MTSTPPRDTSSTCASRPSTPGAPDDDEWIKCWSEETRTITPRQYDPVLRPYPDWMPPDRAAMVAAIYALEAVVPRAPSVMRRTGRGCVPWRSRRRFVVHAHLRRVYDDA